MFYPFLTFFNFRPDADEPEYWKARLGDIELQVL